MKEAKKVIIGITVIVSIIIWVQVLGVWITNIDDILEEISRYGSRIKNITDISEEMPLKSVKDLLNAGSFTENNRIYLELTSEESDGKALSAWIQGEYVEFFEIIPSEISNETYMLMLEELATDISIPKGSRNIKNKMIKVEKAMNAVLEQNSKLRKLHLERMSTLARISAIQNSELAYYADSQGDIVKRNQAHEDYQRYQAISQLTELLYLLEVGNKTIGIGGITLWEESVTLSSLTINEWGRVKFEMKGSLSGLFAEKVFEDIEINDVEVDIDKGGLWDRALAKALKNLLELRENKNETIEYINDLLGIIVEKGVTITSPILGEMVAKAKTIREIERLTREEFELQREMWALLLGVDYIIIDVSDDSSSKYISIQIEIPSYKTLKTIKYFEEKGISEFFKEHKNDEGKHEYGTWNEFEDKSKRGWYKDNTELAEYQFLSGEGDLKMEDINVEVLIDVIQEGMPVGMNDEISIMREWLKSKGE